MYKRYQAMYAYFNGMTLTEAAKMVGVNPGLSYTRPIYVLAKADKQKQEEFRKEFEEIKKNSWMMK